MHGFRLSRFEMTEENPRKMLISTPTDEKNYCFDAFHICIEKCII